MIVFMAEGCVADWSALYLKESLHASARFIPLGYAGFAIAMTVGRLNGDQLIMRFGSKNIVVTGSILSAAGFLLVVISPAVIPAIVGYIMVGFGCCCIVPVLFSASGKIPGVGAVEGYAMVTTGGLVGFLTGPSVIGFISQKAGLATALSLLVLLAALASLVAWKNNLLDNKKLTGATIEYDEQIY
jgi:MFS family permease